MSRDAPLAELVKALGFSFGRTIVREANRAGLPVPRPLHWSSAPAQLTPTALATPSIPPAPRESPWIKTGR